MDVRSDRLDAALLRLVGVMVVGGMLSYLDATVVNVGIKTLTGAFDASLSTMGWVATGYLLAQAAAIPLAGWAVERYGAKRMWLVGLTVLLVGSALCAVAWNPGSLIAFRVVQGFGGGMVDPIMMTVVAQAAGPARMGRVMGIMSVPITLGPVVGPVLGGLILGSLSWQWLFLLNVPIAALALALAVRTIPADPPVFGRPAPIDALGVVLLCPGSAALVYGLSQAGEAGFGAPRVVIGLAAGLALVAAYVVHALRTKVTPLIDLRLFAGKGFAASCVIMFLVGGTLFALLFVLPLYYQEVRVHGVLSAGLLVVPLALGMPFLAPFMGRLADGIGSNILVPVGGGLVAAGMFVYFVAGPGTSQILLTGAQVVAGLGMAAIGPPTMSALYRTVPAAKVPTATGAIFIVNLIGASLGIAVTTLIMQHGARNGSLAEAAGHAFLWPFVCGLVILAAGLLLPGRPSKDVPPGPTPVGEPVDAVPVPQEGR
ncbi:MFS transporter [Sphaerisporangium album]|uniref:MFS transporter n=1 Tax=Sphaerisporangium album TaxID=509200 RepID=A0A367FRE1_9ACTN|nr:DHA2 family efflux MFS transporter permease subunit [Sphaerisporangium album]RCG32841.1 MFS transporter [Sphaerisporangium album]